MTWLFIFLLLTAIDVPGWLWFAWLAFTVIKFWVILDS